MVLNRADRSHAVVGAFVLAGAILFSALFIHATSRTLGRGRAVLWVSLPSAEGLSRGDQLLFRGVKVGEVRGMSFSPEGDVLVRTILMQPVPVTTSARARLVAADMFGRQTVVLEELPGGRALGPGDTLHGVRPVSLNGRIDGMAARIERVVGDTTIHGLHLLLADAAAAAGSFERTMHVVQEVVSGNALPLARTLDGTGGLLDNLRSATDPGRLDVAHERTLRALDNIDRATARLDTASALLVTTLARVEAGGGSIGRLTTDDALYDRAVAALGEVESLLGDVRRNPKRYLTVRIF
jgi:phospholipid/cholesterol/gamma-HCH transport system substrate-binding protein